MTVEIVDDNNRTECGVSELFDRVLDRVTELSRDAKRISDNLGPEAAYC